MRVLFVSLAAAFYLHPPVAPPANRPAWTVQGPAASMAMPVAFRGTRASMLRMQETSETTKGISKILGGGKTSSEIRRDPTSNTIAVISTTLVILGIAYGAVNPDVVENLAKSFPR